MTGSVAVMSLTSNEEAIVKRTWKAVSTDVESASWHIFRIFFRENPSYQKVFKGFKDVPMEELRADHKLRAHAASVVYQLSMLVDNLDNLEVYNEMLDRLAANHKRHHISLEMFVTLEESLILFLKDRLGDNQMNEEAVRAWRKAYRLLIDRVKPNL